jgi:hypothetical protein
MPTHNIEIVYRTFCHPEAHGREPMPGEYAWEFLFRLDDGRVLRVQMGKEARDAFYRMLQQDAADDACERLIG